MAGSGQTVVNILIVILVIMTRTPPYITNPLWQDSLKPQAGPSPTIQPGNQSHWQPVQNATSTVQQIQPYFVFAFTVILQFVLFGLSFAFCLLFHIGDIGPKEWRYPQKWLILTGLTQMISTVLFTYSISGSRSPPYLVAVLANFNIPIQFMTRLLILRKWPTKRKMICAAVVMGAEFVSLIPTIFPSLENQSQHEEEGGAPGAQKIIWIFVFTSCMVPMTMNNALLEKVVKDKDETVQEEDGEDKCTGGSELSLMFVTFWFAVWNLVFTASMFWVDFVPGFGTSGSIHEFGEKFLFNLGCIFGIGERCTSSVYVFGWLTLLVNLSQFVANPVILKYSEGANYKMVVLALRSPIVLLFWTLFDEHPFQWHPHVQLSTYLSIAALIIMVPAIYFYNTGAPEKNLTKNKKQHSTSTAAFDDTDDLVTNEEQPYWDSENYNPSLYSNSTKSEAVGNVTIN